MTKRSITLKVASPCQADWESMTGDEATRFCGQCKQNVYQLSNMTTEQVEELLLKRKGLRTCGRFYQRADGTILTSNCSVGAKQKRKRRVLQVFGAAAISASAIGIGAAFQPDSPAMAPDEIVQERENEDLHMRMGGIAEIEELPGIIETVKPTPIEEPRMIMGDVAVIEPSMGELTIVEPEDSE